jgi:hypothetical protein
LPTTASNATLPRFSWAKRKKSSWASRLQRRPGWRETSAPRALDGPDVELDAGDLVGQRAGLAPEAEEAVDAHVRKRAVAAGGIEHRVAGLAQRPAGERFGERRRV